MTSYLVDLVLRKTRDPWWEVETKNTQIESARVCQFYYRSLFRRRIEIFPKILSRFKESIPEHLNIKLVVELRSEVDVLFCCITRWRGEKFVQKHSKKGKMSGKFNVLVIPRDLCKLNSPWSSRLELNIFATSPRYFRFGQFEKRKNVLDDCCFYHCNNWWAKYYNGLEWIILLVILRLLIHECVDQGCMNSVQICYDRAEQGSIVWTKFVDPWSCSD